MSLTCLSQVVLHNTSGTRDALYVVQVQQDITAAGTEYLAVGYFGRRGATLAPAPKYKGPSRSMADAEANKLERSKRSGGYLDYAGGSTFPGLPAGAPTFGGPPTSSPASVAAAAAASAVPGGPSPMLAEVLTLDQLENFIKDPNWAFQKKFDGERMPVSIRRSGLVATNRKGKVRAMASAIETLLKKLIAQPDFSDDRESQVDGEVMLGDEYVIYDAVTIRDNDIRQLPYYERYAQLEALLAKQPQLLAETAWSEEEKRAMVERARREEWEGLMARHIDEAYVNGRTGWLLKCKLWETATCRVVAVNAKRSVQLAVREADNTETSCGNVTVPPDQAVPKPGDLVEVRYLYCTDGGKLYQTVLQRVRTDVDDADYRSTLRAAPPEKRRDAAESASAELTADEAELI